MILKEKCLICNKECVSLKDHVKIHNMTTKTYYDTYLKKPNECICKICKGPTPFRGLKHGYPNTYCSNQCHALDEEANKKHSLILKNRSQKEKDETRKKQIETWKKTMGENWSTVMAQRACASYDKNHTDENGEPISTGGPFANKLVREKCEKRWGCISPACKKEVQDKISESVKEIRNTEDNINLFYKKTLQKYQTFNSNLVDYNGKFTYICPNCNETLNFDLQYLRRRLKFNIDLCYKCVPKSGTSLPEKQLFEYIKTCYSGEIVENDKHILDGRELDIYLPNLNLAFEFDGKYWHMDPDMFDGSDFNYHKGKTAQEIWDYDKQKDLDCLNKNIKLIHIKEMDWLNKNENTKKLIENLIKNSEVIK